MLHEDDAILVARDRRLVGLALLLDDAAMTATLRSVAPSAGIESVEAHYLRYKPGTNCVCSYRVRADGVTTQLYAKAFAPDDPGLEKTHSPIAQSELGAA